MGYVVQAKGAVTAHRAHATPETLTYCGLGPPPKPRYRTKPVSLREHVLTGGRTAAVTPTWRAGVKGNLTSQAAEGKCRPCR
ncbi:hypothetical protein [Streptosporangium lutulentum]|uniref:Uncharacterized protein n=1 Tax=Streptosporangium lutulentum TaxID=1461250 RepID=A0ABT9QC67_9ACTN|nr:hypothetical protein [Streptosporangium lutulentum]MDP9843903.1 hypothetical protein [Streptosporangium lutulentum]